MQSKMGNSCPMQSKMGNSCSMQSKMGNSCLMQCLLFALVVVTRQHRPETTTAQTPVSSHRPIGSLVSLLIQQAVELSALKAELSSLTAELSSLTAELSAVKKRAATKADLEKTKNDIEVKLRQNQGSTFVRWGRKRCSNSTTLIYSGVAAGKKHDHAGSGTNYLCLPTKPQFDGTVFQFGGTIYGTEYEVPGPHYDHDMPCAVCRAPQPTTIMVPATLTCPAGWVTQYTGHLVGQHTNHRATEYICLDSSPEHVYGSHTSRTDSFVYNLNIGCGGLPCPPFRGDQVFTCVVCSQ